jgi:hypothetical protein
VFSSLVGRTFGARIVPDKSVSVGLSLLDLHWHHTPRADAGSPHARDLDELEQFLITRAYEFKSGGVLVMAYIQREENSSHSNSLGLSRGETMPTLPTTMSPEEQQQQQGPWNRPEFPRLRSSSARVSKNEDAWAQMSSVLKLCVQRLIGNHLLPPDVARQLVDVCFNLALFAYMPRALNVISAMQGLPLLIRTPKQSRAVLDAVQHLWTIQWSCGLGPEPSSTSATSSDHASHDIPVTYEPPFQLVHPGCMAAKQAKMEDKMKASGDGSAPSTPPADAVESVCELVKLLYEHHFRCVLKGHGFTGHDIEASVEHLVCVFVLAYLGRLPIRMMGTLWNTLREKVEAGALDWLKLDFAIVALRRL